MSAIHVRDGDHLEIELSDTTGLLGRCSDVLTDLIECTAAVNERFASIASATRVTLTFLERGLG